jgi:lysophospholipase L1-like esterase
VAQPILTSLHVEQQEALARMLGERYRDNPHVRYFNPGAGGPLVDMRDARDAFDGMHLTARGNARIAEALVTPALEMIRR